MLIMLKGLRKKERTKKIIFLLIIGIMVLAFILWGAGAYKESSKGPGYAGIIFGRKVSIPEFRKTYSATLNDLRLKFGENLNRILPYINLNNQAWMKLILLEHAKKLNIKISNQEVIQDIIHNPLFFRDGKFNQDTYERLIRYYLKTLPRDFEEQTRITLTLKKLYEHLTQEAAISDEELLAAYKKEFETVSMHYIKAADKDFLNQVRITDQELNDYYQKNSSQFRRPPTVSIEYVGTDFPEGVPEEIEKIKIFDNVRYSYPNIKNSKELKDAAVGSITYHKPETFSFNEPVDAIVSPEFYEYCFSLKEGQTSPVIQTEKGVYVLRVLKKNDSYVPALEQVKAKAEEALKLEKAKEEAKNKIEAHKNQINEYLKTKPSLSLKKAGELLKVEVKTTPQFKLTETIPGIELSQEIRNAAFALKPGQISAILSSPSAFFLIEQDKLTAIDEEKFKKEKDTYRKKLLEEKKQGFFNNLVKELMFKANPKDFTSSSNPME